MNFWRTLRAVLDDDSVLRQHVVKGLQNFVSDEWARHKLRVPDAGMLLACYAAAAGMEGVPPVSDFFATYLDESFVRGAMWWQKPAYQNGAGMSARSEVSAVAKSVGTKSYDAKV